MRLCGGARRDCGRRAAICDRDTFFRARVRCRQTAHSAPQASQKKPTSVAVPGMGIAAYRSSPSPRSTGTAQARRQRGQQRFSWSVRARVRGSIRFERCRDSIVSVRGIGSCSRRPNRSTVARLLFRKNGRITGSFSSLTIRNGGRDESRLKTGTRLILEPFHNVGESGIGGIHSAGWNHTLAIENWQGFSIARLRLIT